MNVLFVASECAPFVKTGGLADVIGAMPKALKSLGVAVRVLLPAYPALAAETARGTVVMEIADLYGGAARVLQISAAQIELLLLDAPHLYDRPGNIYVDGNNVDWHDNHLRFAALSRVGADIALRGAGGWRPDLINCHDWQAGLVSAFLQQAAASQPVSAPPVVMTVHNIAFQGLFAGEVRTELGLSESLYTMHGVEYFGRVGFLKGGLALAEKITTVSPTYAQELLTPQFGMGLDGLLLSREADFQGILNGIDTEVWNPASDAELVAPYSADDLSGKAKNRSHLERHFNLTSNSHAPLFCVVSRLSEQKGLDLLLECLPALVERGARLALLGTGDKSLERAFVAASQRYHGSVGVIIAYDEALSHRVQGGSDAILIPSRFEPCGLTQLCALRYGTLPIVARTGGLADTVIDANDAALASGCATGFVFSPDTVASLDAAIQQSCRLFGQRQTWSLMMRQAMQQRVSWDRSARAYHRLYQSLTATTESADLLHD